jgi:hypothetical protein
MMMVSVYVTARFPEGSMPRTSNRSSMLGRTRRFVTLHADERRRRSRIREAGGEFGPWKSPNEIMGQVRHRTAEMGVGPKLIIQREHDREQLSIRELESEPTGPDLGCHPDIETIHYAVWDRFAGEVRSAGRFVCRFIDQTLVVSRHGYLGNVPPPPWRGAAEDIFVTTGGMPKVIEVARFIIAQTIGGNLDAHHVIFDDRIWTAGSGERPYGGNRHYHCHADVKGGRPCNP